MGWPRGDWCSSTRSHAAFFLAMARLALSLEISPTGYQGCYNRNANFAMRSKHCR